MGKKTLIILLLIPFILFFSGNSGAEGGSHKITVYKSKFCGCCSNWSHYLGERGFEVTEKAIKNVASLKKKFGIPERLSSCHTAVVSGYVIEGHVPVEDIQRLLSEKPDIRGLAVRGMPAGAPGMEGGRQKEAFSVVAIRKNGSTYIYSRHKGH